MTAKKVAIGCGSAFILMILLLAGGKVFSNAHGASDFEDEIKAARAEGIPTTWQEFAATIKPARPEENAAGLYRELLKHKLPQKSSTTLQSKLDLHPVANNLASAKAWLAPLGAELALMDRAAAKPRCWFDRDWSKGLTILLPEYSPMRRASALIGLRGSIAVAEGRPADALKSVLEIIQISKHIGEEQTEFSMILREELIRSASHHVLLWLLTHRGDPTYSACFQALQAAWPRADLRQMHRDDLLTMVDVARFSQTAEGRKEIGLKDDDESIKDQIAPWIHNQPEAKAQLVSACRDTWRAYPLPLPERIKALAAAEAKRSTALRAFPTAFDVEHELMSADLRRDVNDFAWEATRLANVALFRTLSTKRQPSRMTFPDLMSPYNGKPILVTMANGQVVANVSSSNKELEFAPIKIPTDADLGRYRPPN